MIRPALAFCLLAAPGWADPISARGYVIGCGDGACSIAAAGFILTVAAQGSDPEVWRRLQGLEPLTAVSFEGELGALGDITAPVTLSDLETRHDDPYQGLLRQAQGDWRPMGDDSGFLIRIKGMEWQELADGAVSADFLIQPSDSCPSGAAVEGTALTLLPIGGDPSSAVCWRVDGASRDQLQIRDLTGGQGQVTLLRR